MIVSGGLITVSKACNGLLCFSDRTYMAMWQIKKKDGHLTSGVSMPQCSASHSLFLCERSWSTAATGDGMFGWSSSELYKEQQPLLVSTGR